MCGGDAEDFSGLNRKERRDGFDRRYERRRALAAHLGGGEVRTLAFVDTAKQGKKLLEEAETYPLSLVEYVQRVLRDRLEEAERSLPNLKETRHGAG